MATPAPANPDAGAAAAADKLLLIDEAWKVVQKLRATIFKELELIQSGGSNANELARFEKIEKLMQNYRLACIETIWADFRLAKEKKVEDTLWAVHSQVTKTYRKVISKTSSNAQAVYKRKLEKLYGTYLTTAQYFYRGWLQRVCARYNLQDLSRVARLAKLEMAVPDADKIDAKAEKLDDIVKDSCHKTLIYLGDLARYRTLLRAKDRNFENALAYYSLANDLIPESGFGHHQSAVIYGEINDHLQVVYHLIRAMDCDKPHPNAWANLEREFRDGFNKHKGTGAKNVLVTWFIKLHGFYFHGKDFNERKELEAEVEHRLAVAMKSATDPTSDIQLWEMTLINITSYEAYLRRLQEERTEDRARSCDFTLTYNLKTIVNISKLLKDEMSELLTRDPADTAASDGQTKYTPTFSRVLPLLRFYMAWLCFYNPELAELQSTLEPLFGNMCKALSNTLSLLFQLLPNSAFAGKSVSWRFLEDDMALGINCLTGPNLPRGCQLQHDALTKKLKPRRDEVPDAAKYSEDDITFTRALDIILCAIELAEKSRFPFDYVTNGASGYGTIVYCENGKPNPVDKTQEAQASQPIRAVHEDGNTGSALKAQEGQTPPQQTPQRTTPAQVATVPNAPPIVSGLLASHPSLLGYESNELSENLDFYGDHLRYFNSSRRTAAAAATTSAATASAVTGTSATGNAAPVNVAIGNSHQAPTDQPSQLAMVSDFPVENQLYNMLNDFMVPPELPSVGTKPAIATPTRPLLQEESSFGISSAATGNALASSSASPAPSSATAKTFPTLPWNYFYTPAPVDTAMRNSSVGNGAVGWNDVRPATSGYPVQLPANQALNNPLGPQHHRQSSSGLNIGDYGGQQWQSSGPGAWGPSTRGSFTADPMQSSIWAPSATDIRQLGQQAAAAPVSSPFPSFTFSGNTSSLPSVHSPMGLPMRDQVASYQQQDAMRSPLSANPLRSAYPIGYTAGYTSTPHGFKDKGLKGYTGGYTGYAPVYQRRYEDDQDAQDGWIVPFSQNTSSQATAATMQNPLQGAQVDVAAKQSINNFPKS